jgi:hypothetical protein
MAIWAGDGRIVDAGVGGDICLGSGTREPREAMSALGADDSCLVSDVVRIAPGCQRSNAMTASG